MKNILSLSILVCFLTQTQAQWTTGTDIPEGIRAGNTISHIIDGKAYIYLFGGRNDEDIVSKKSYRYSLADNSWQTLEDLPREALGASGARLGNDIYIMGGGVPGNATKQVLKYDIGENSWTTVADMPQIYGDGDAVAYQDSLIYVVGHWSNEKTYVYNVNTDKWREGSTIPSPGTALSYGALSVFENKLVYVGGSNGTFSPTYWNKVWIGEIDQTDRSIINWTEGTPFPGQTRTFFELNPWDNGLILIGGTTDNTFETYTNENYFYDVNADTWTALTPKPTAWNTGNAVSLFVDGVWKLVCTGGFAENYLLETEIYTQENMGNTEVVNDQSCHLKNMRAIGGKNPSLHFCTEENGNIELKIWDLQGRLIKQNQSIESRAGTHRINLNEFRLSNGIYFCQLLQNGNAQTKKIYVLE